MTDIAKLSGVGPALAGVLREHGVSTIDAVLKLERHELQKIPGIGAARAVRLKQAAEAASTDDAVQPVSKGRKGSSRKTKAKEEGAKSSSVEAPETISEREKTLNAALAAAEAAREAAEQKAMKAKAKAKKAARMAQGLADEFAAAKVKAKEKAKKVKANARKAIAREKAKAKAILAEREAEQAAMMAESQTKPKKRKKKTKGDSAKKAKK